MHGYPYCTVCNSNCNHIRQKIRRFSLSIPAKQNKNKNEIISHIKHTKEKQKAKTQKNQKHTHTHTHTHTKGAGAIISEDGTVIERKNAGTTLADKCICVSGDILQPMILNAKQPKLYFKGFVIEILKVITNWSYGIEFGLTNTDPNLLSLTEIEEFLRPKFNFMFCVCFFCFVCFFCAVSQFFFVRIFAFSQFFSFFFVFCTLLLCKVEAYNAVKCVCNDVCVDCIVCEVL